MASLDSKGYGQISSQRGKSPHHAHRLSYELHKGPTNGLCVCHKCDVPSCVNPDHLFLGTHADNMRDMHSKGRWKPNPATGENHVNAKLTKQAVSDIRKQEKTAEEYAIQYGVVPHTIRNVWRGAAWRLA